jgi:hypothetical protein
MRLSISRDTFLWYVVPIVLFFTIALIFFSRPINLSDARLERFSDPLSPDIPLQLHEGESYSYKYEIGGANLSGTYTVSSSLGGCTLVRGNAVYNGQPAELSACVYPDNGSFSDPNQELDFFQPWMLALKPGFNWTAGARIVYGTSGVEDVTTTRYAFVMPDTHLGRPAFKVIATTDRIFQGQSMAHAERTLWIDIEKRVLLESISTDFSVRITSAPFTIAEQ